MATYVGMLIGAACLVAHLAYCRWKCGRWPNFLRLVISVLAGTGTAWGLQLAAVVLRPPSDRPVTVAVDEYRVALFVGMLCVFAVAVFALYDNWNDMRGPTAGKKQPAPDPPPAA